MSTEGATAAAREGWALQQQPDGTLEIETIDRSNSTGVTLPNDEAALRAFRASLDKGNVHAAEAFHMLFASATTEYLQPFFRNPILRAVKRDILLRAGVEVARESNALTDEAAIAALTIKQLGTKAQAILTRRGLTDAVIKGNLVYQLWTDGGPEFRKAVLSRMQGQETGRSALH